MVPIFSAFDRDYYARIIPHHLAEIQCYPSIVLTCLEKEGFTVNLTGQQQRAVALDEAHEMCINKDLKTAVVRPTESYLQKTSLFFNDCIILYKNLLHQLFPPQSGSHIYPSEILDSSPQTYRCEENIMEMCNLIISKSLFPASQCTTRGLPNVFTGQPATNEQTSDMFSFYQIGEQSYQNYVKYRRVWLLSASA